MGKHLKNRIYDRLRATILTDSPLPHTALQSPNVRYVRLCDAFEYARGAFNTRKEAKRYRKNIIMRPSRHHPGFHELYACRHPKYWSQACIDNRECIKQAQRLAHQIEHNHSFAALEWRVRFFAQYYNTGPGETPYPHFYTFVFTTIYRALRQKQQPSVQPLCQTQHSSIQPLHSYYRYPLRAVASRLYA